MEQRPPCVMAAGVAAAAISAERPRLKGMASGRAWGGLNYDGAASFASPAGERLF